MPIDPSVAFGCHVEGYTEKGVVIRLEETTYPLAQQKQEAAVKAWRVEVPFEMLKKKPALTIGGEIAVLWDEARPQPSAQMEGAAIAMMIAVMLTPEGGNVLSMPTP